MIIPNKKDLEAIKAHLLSVDTNNADTSEILREYFNGITEKKPKPVRINKLAEASNVEELVGDNLEYVYDRAIMMAKRLDRLTNDIAQTNNVISADLDALEGLVAQAKDAVQELTFAKSDEGTDFLWVGDSFNTNLFVNDKSTVYVDTDRGEITLLPEEYLDVEGFSVVLDTDSLIAQQALPGANLLINEFQTDQSNGNPTVLFDKANSNSYESLTDEDILTWFEVERVFIPKKQKLVQKGKAWVSDSSGQLSDVLEKTSNLDWESEVVWPGLSSSVKVPIVQFLDPDKISKIESNPDYQDRDYGTTLNFQLLLDTPQELSSIVLTPYIRPGYPDLEVLRIEAELEGLSQPVPIVTSRSLTQTKATTDAITTSISKKSSEITEGVRFQIPSDRKVKALRFSIYGGPKSNELLAHPWIWVNIHRRSERNYGLFSSVDHEDIPKRLPIYEKPPILRADQKIDTISSAVFLSPTTQAPANGTVIGVDDKSGPLAGLTSAAQYGVSTIRTSNLGTSFLAGLANSLVDRVLNIGGFSRDFTVTEQDSGFDVFEGARSNVCIRDLTLEKVSFSPDGVLYTREREFPAFVSSFGLFVEEEIPDNWGEGNWLEYYVKFDNNDEWIRIQPLRGQDVDQSLQFDQPVKKFQLQVRVNGNPQDSVHTPILKHYSAKGLPA